MSAAKSQHESVGLLENGGAELRHEVAVRLHALTCALHHALRCTLGVATVAAGLRLGLAALDAALHFLLEVLKLRLDD
jgi:hypothetical protein